MLGAIAPAESVADNPATPKKIQFLQVQMWLVCSGQDNGRSSIVLLSICLVFPVALVSD